MRCFLLIILITLNLSSMAQNGQAVTTKRTFSRTTSVSLEINAEPTMIWNLLTDASKFSDWNSTVVELEGHIKIGEKIHLKSTLDPSRTFKLKVKEMVPHQKMVWGDAMGKRTYLLEELDKDHTKFTMTEKIGGIMFPLFANKIPSFNETFESFARDLKNTAEKH